MKKYCDVAILGGGPAGYAAALRAKNLGQKVVVIETRPCMGGICLHAGCIPSKTLSHLAYIVNETKRLNASGIDFDRLKIDLNKIRLLKNSIINRLATGLTYLFKKNKIEILTGFGKFIDANQIEISGQKNKSVVSFKNAIIASGSKPSKLPFVKDDPRILDSGSALEINFIPKKLLIIGSGIISLEIAFIYEALGSEIVIFEIKKEILPEFDRDLTAPLQKALSKKCREISLGTEIVAIESKADGLYVSYKKDNGKQKLQIFDAILVAIGRREPNIANMNIEKLGILTDIEGFISVNERMQTNFKHIYAAGDVVGYPMLAHKAYAEGRLAAEEITGKSEGFKKQLMPCVIYSDPEIATVGLSEQEAIQKNIKYEVETFSWQALGRALTIDRPKGLTKLIFDKKTLRLLGAGVVGVNASELIAELVLAIKMKATVKDIASIVHPHPTLSEATMYAAQMFLDKKLS